MPKKYPKKVIITLSDDGINRPTVSALVETFSHLFSNLKTSLFA